MDKSMDKAYIYNGKWVLINVYFYTFWMLRDEFAKYII